MTLVRVESSSRAPDADVVELKVAAEIVTETLEECQFLLAEADRSAAEVRAQADDDAARSRAEAAKRAKQAVEGALAASGTLTDEAHVRASAIVGEAEARRAEVDRRISAIRQATRAAGAYIDRTTRDADRWAVNRREGSETEAVALVEAAWRASIALQHELVEEAEAEATEVLARADAEAARLRADAVRLHEEAARVRESAQRYADGLLVATLAETPGSATAAEPDPRRSLLRTVARKLTPVAVVLVLVLGLRVFVAAPYTVTARSMEPTLHDGDVVMVNKVPYNLRSPARGDLVVIEASPETGGEEIVKRVVGLAGERVQAIAGRIWVDGALIDEGYLDDGLITAPFGPVDVGDEEIFVLGDNRTLSLDSRIFGPVDVDDVIGRVDAVIWPLGEMRSMGG